MKNKDMDQEGHLDLLLSEAAREETALPEGLLQKVMDDAVQMQPQPNVPTSQRQGTLSRLAAFFGGWPTVGGLAAASCAGFWIGVNPPQYLPDPSELLLGAQAEIASLEDVEVSGFGWDFEEQ